MEYLNTLWQWINDNAGVLSISITIIPLLAAFIQYIYTKSLENQRYVFDTYHKLIKGLVYSPKHEAMRLDRQIAIIYELRHFQKYHEVSIRILEGVRETWKDKQKRLLDEIDYSILHMKKVKKHRRIKEKVVFVFVISVLLAALIL